MCSHLWKISQQMIADFEIKINEYSKPTECIIKNQFVRKTIMSSQRHRVHQRIDNKNMYNSFF